MALIGFVFKLEAVENPNECQTNSDCEETLMACVEDDSGFRKCVNPWDGAKCGTNTVWEVVNQEAQCRCQDKHVGNPNLGCTKVECQHRGDCKGTKFCQVRCVGMPRSLDWTNQGKQTWHII